ncbi:MAG: zinc ribbon domain-containing protein [Deltaproteobacteria bacterium]|nr:zinc ribbon domain-containing protein [Deltaproteobacteria bacterium]
MPIFEYLCEDCGRGFEVLVLKSSDKIVCPVCGRENCQKKLSTFRSRVSGGNGAGDFSPSSGGCAGCAASSCASCGVSR